jgi:hypothetical protein
MRQQDSSTMQRFNDAARSLCLIAAGLLAGAFLSAQTLEQRPVPNPAAPPDAPSFGGSSDAPAPSSSIVPRGTNLQVQIARHYPMKLNQPVEGVLLFPVFVDGNLAVPAGTPLRGSIVALLPDRKTRWHSRLHGDFTPFRIAQVQFNELVLPAGPIPISTGGATIGAPVLHLAAPGATRHRSFFSRSLRMAAGQLHDRVAWFTAPGFGDRALQVFYHQLPWHPQRIEAKTAWSFDLQTPPPLAPAPPAVAAAGPPAQTAKPETWSVRALLTGGLTSATARSGDMVKALVVEPVFDSEHRLVVPQDSVLEGKVTTAKPTHSLGRNGKLRFTFQRVLFPQGANRPVEGALAGATTDRAQALSLDAEGTISPRNQASALAPLLLTVLAGRALDEDGNLTATTGVASNGFGFIGRPVGVASGSRNLAAGIGYYAAALSVYENFLSPGRDVVFPKDTRIEIETTPLRAPVLTPATP